MKTIKAKRSKAGTMVERLAARGLEPPVRLGDLDRRAAEGDAPAGEYYDGVTLYTWSIRDDQAWRHERGPDGQNWGDWRLAARQKVAS